MTFTPRIDVLPPSQRALWPELRAVPRRYVLYGGTALALRLAHRASVDFDFFAHDPLDHRELEQALSFVKQGETVLEGPNERTVLTGRAGASVKVSFFWRRHDRPGGRPRNDARRRPAPALAFHLAGQG